MQAVLWPVVWEWGSSEGQRGDYPKVGNESPLLPRCYQVLRGQVRGIGDLLIIVVLVFWTLRVAASLRGVFNVNETRFSKPFSIFSA